LLPLTKARSFGYRLRMTVQQSLLADESLEGDLDGGSGN